MGHSVASAHMSSAASDLKEAGEGGLQCAWKRTGLQPSCLLRRPGRKVGRQDRGKDSRFYDCKEETLVS